MNYTRAIRDISKNDVACAGGKGASLGELTQAGIPVPGGFVVVADAFEKFIEETFLRAEMEAELEKVNHKEMESIERASEVIQGVILSSEIPMDIQEEILSQFSKLGAEFVAVRSSATAEDSSSAAWAGQLDSFLNTTEATLLQNIKKCWASLFTPRALFYRFEKDLHQTFISVAVVIQKMAASEVSGIAFSVHPVTEDPNQMIIEAGFGLGEAIVSGQITPDSYVIRKDTLEIGDTHIAVQTKEIVRSLGGGSEWKEVTDGGRQKLKDKEIKELAEMVMKIEQHYGFPCDIEWAREKGQFYIVQSRPITTLTSTVKKVIPAIRKEEYILSFWVQGVNVFVTDIHREVYRDLEVLYIIEQGLFKQYFSRSAFQRALENGLKFYSDKDAVTKYKQMLTAHCQTFEQFFKEEVLSKHSLEQTTLKRFCEYTVILCREYTKMNFEYTDKAFLEKENNEIIEGNLQLVLTFKDEIRAFMNKVLFEEQGYVHTLYTILSKQFSLSPAVLENLTQKELLDLYTNEQPDLAKVMNRQRIFVETYDQVAPYEGERAEAILHEFQETPTPTTTIKGQVASRGIVRGKVKIIPVDYSDFDRINAEIDSMTQGDILVAETTAPELMVACKKASAIVTDMGGLMSHAAIVSREFGIPCMVGVGNATKILKDGDLVEVDAEEGVIKIIDSLE